MPLNKQDTSIIDIVKENIASKTKIKAPRINSKNFEMNRCVFGTNA